MNTQQHIINHLYELFSYTSEKSTSNLTIESNFSAITTKDSTWPNFIFNIKLNTKTFTTIKQGIENKTLPNQFILNNNQVDTYEDLLTENNFFPIAEWSCLKLENNELKQIKNKRLSIKKITQKYDLNEWIKVASSGFGELDKNLFNTNDFNLYGGFLNNKLITTALLFNHNNTAGIYHVVTTPTQRGKGYGSEIFSYCELEALNNGANQVIAQSTTEGLNSWKNTGMKSYGKFYLFCWNKPKQ